MKMTNICERSGKLALSQKRIASAVFIFTMAFGMSTTAILAQVAPSTPSEPVASISVLPSDAPPLTITLQDALQRARGNDPQYRSVVTDLGLAREDRVQARAGLLPGVSYNNSFINTGARDRSPTAPGPPLAQEVASLPTTGCMNTSARPMLMRPF